MHLPLADLIRPRFGKRYTRAGAGVAGSILLTLAIGCGEVMTGQDSAALPPELGRGCLLVQSAEFGVEGAIATIDLARGEVQASVTSTFHDATLHPWERGVFVLNRLGRDSIQALDASTGWRTVFEATLPERTNPWDVYLDAEGRGVIAGYGSGALHPFELAGDTLTWSPPMSLGEVADADGNAEPAFLWRQEGALFVVVQRLRAFGCSERAPAVLELAWPSLSVVAERALPGCNPSDVVHTEDGTWIALSGAFRSLADTFGEPITDDGGLVWLSATPGASPRLVANETRLDGDLVSISPAQGGGLWATVADEQNAMRIVHVREQQGQVVVTDTPIVGRTAFDLWDTGEGLLIADRDPVRPGIRLLSPDTGASIAGPVALPLPPVSMLQVPACAVAR